MNCQMESSNDLLNICSALKECLTLTTTGCPKKDFESFPVMVFMFWEALHDTKIPGEAELHKLSKHDYKRSQSYSENVYMS